MKKNFFLLAFFICVLPIFGFEWNLTNDGILTISGKGEMPVFEQQFDPQNFSVIIRSPWGHLKNKIKKVIIEEGVTSVSPSAFQSCENLTEVELNEGLISIEEGAFCFCPIKEITFPATLERIGISAFQGCSEITKLSIPSTVRTIGVSAFEDCYKLKELKLSEGLKFLGDKAFANCDNLEPIPLPKTLLLTGDNIFEKKPQVIFGGNF